MRVIGIIWICLVLVAGCKVTPPVKPQTWPHSGTKIEESLKTVTPAREAIQAAAVEIKTEAAQPKPDAEVIDKQADVVIENASSIQTEEPKIAMAAQAAQDTEKLLKQANDSISALQNKIVDLQEQSKLFFRWIILGAIVLASAGAGLGMYLGNLRLVLAAPIGGGICVALAIISGTIYQWRNAILIGLCISAAVIGIALFVEWKKSGSVLNLFRANDKPTTVVPEATK